MTLASAAFGFGQPLRPNLMFLVGVLALGPILWWIRTLHIQIRRCRDHFLHVGFLSPRVFDRPNPVTFCCDFVSAGTEIVYHVARPLVVR